MSIRRRGSRSVAAVAALSLAAVSSSGGCVHVHIHEAQEGYVVGDEPAAGQAPASEAVPVATAPVAPRAAPAVRVAPRTPTAAVPAVAPSQVERPGGVAMAVDAAAATRAVKEGLDWLARNQRPDGSWAAGDETLATGVTGLAVLAFLGDGQTHQTGEHAEVVARAVRYLKQAQDSEGCFGTRASQHFQYCHGYATLALTEAYAMTASPILKDAASRGVDFVLLSRNPYMGWRYGVRDGDNDTSVTGLMVAVIRSAVAAGLLEDDSGAYLGALAWVEKMTDPATGRVGYQQRGGPPARTMEAIDRFPANESESMTALGVATRIRAGQDPADHPLVRKGADLLLAKLPTWKEPAVDLYYWYHGTNACRLVGGRHWDLWRGAVANALAPSQRTADADPDRGSWDPIDPWGAQGGRVYATALACLCLEMVAR